MTVRSRAAFDTLTELLAHRREKTPDRVAVVFQGKPCTYAELADRAGTVAAWLHEQGVGPGDRVAMMMRNSLEFCYAWLGIAQAGAVSVPINTSMMGEGLRYILEHADVRGVAADVDLSEAVEATGVLRANRFAVVHGATTNERRTALTDVLQSGAEPAGAPVVGRSDPATIIYTSGTTGLPKGVVLPHGSFTNTGAYFAHHLGLTHDDVLHTCLPLFHCNAQQTSLMAALHLGVPLHLNERFSVRNFWTWIRESGATVTNLLGTMLTLLAKVPPADDDADNPLRYVVAAPIPEQLYAPFEERFDVKLVEGYGLTETGTMACINPVDDVRPGTIGRPLEYNELRIVDEQGNDVPDGQPGEIITRTHLPDSYMSGYFRETEKTAEVLRDGWFHTGDLGKRREDGYFVFLDRLKDTIRRRGENISSFLVEKTVLEHPDLLECAVFGVPSELGEEDVKVVAVLRDGAELDPSALVDWCAERMADFMVPRYVEYVDELPRTETGRVHKFHLRAEGAGDAWDALAGSRR